MPVLGGSPTNATSHAISSDKGLAVRPQRVVFRCSADIVQQVARDVRRAAETDSHLMAAPWEELPGTKDFRDLGRTPLGSSPHFAGFV